MCQKNSYYFFFSSASRFLKYAIVMVGLTSSTLRRMARKRVVSASRFLASNEWPVCAPFRRVLVFVRAMRVGNIDSRGPVPDMMIRESLYSPVLQIQITEQSRTIMGHITVRSSGWALTSLTPKLACPGSLWMSGCIHSIAPCC